MPTKKPAPASQVSRPANFSVRLSEVDAQRVKAIADAHDWPMAKTIQKLVTAALDAKVLK